MNLNFKKKMVIGVSITPEMGLEVAQIDYTNNTVLSYASKALNYDIIRKEVADIDIFKETLQELLEEMAIPKGSEVVLTLPPAAFNVVDYRASFTEDEVKNIIEEELIANKIFEETEPAFDFIKLNNSTVQFSKYYYAGVSKVMLIEIAMIIKELGYSLIAIDNTVTSVLRSLIYNARVNTAPDFNWVMLLIEKNSCKIISMLGRNFVEFFEEKVSIGEVLEEDDNYSTVLSAINPILKNLPSKCLYIISKTNVISAQKIAGKLSYNGQIVHEEINSYSKAPFIELSPELSDSGINLISLDVIGAAIYNDFDDISNREFNWFNEQLGDIYLNEQPVIVTIGGRKHKLSLENMIRFSIVCAVPLILIGIAAFVYLSSIIMTNNQKLEDIKAQIQLTQQKLSKHSNISTELFDEGDEIRLGLITNKNIFTYYQIVGTEIPKKLWLTSMNLGKNITIEGQADNLESIYSFFRNVRDYNPKFPIKIQSLNVANSSKLTTLNDDASFDTATIMSTMSSDYYSFTISDVAVAKEPKQTKKKGSKLEPLPDNLK